MAACCVALHVCYYLLLFAMVACARCDREHLDTVGCLTCIESAWGQIVCFLFCCCEEDALSSILLLLLLGDFGGSPDV